MSGGGDEPSYEVTEEAAFFGFLLGTSAAVIAYLFGTRFLNVSTGIAYSVAMQAFLGIGIATFWLVLREFGGLGATDSSETDSDSN